MSRIYCDYNATSPLADSVKEYLAKGDFAFENPASVHTSGKKARHSIKESSNYISKYFNIDHELFYHSGATEGANTLLQNNGHLFYFSSDHPCVTQLAKNIPSTSLKINEVGEFDVNEVVNQISKIDGPKILNFTWVHNETGIVWSLELAREIKRRTDCLIHVDAAQVVGKIENYNTLDSELDFYTFSAHKFGALKGIGWSFYKDSTLVRPLLFGGGQQASLRSGTQNAMGIKSIELALNDIQGNFNLASLLENKLRIENALKEQFGERVIIVGERATRNLNTINLIFKTEKADITLAAIDLAGLDVGTGSACSSASAKKSQTLIDMGYEDYAHHGLRISIGTNTPVEQVISKLVSALGNFC